MRIDIVTLFPELCDGFLSTSILGRARAKNLFEAHCHQIRDYTKNKQRQTDDYPYGAGQCPHSGRTPAQGFHSWKADGRFPRYRAARRRSKTPHGLMSRSTAMRSN